MKLTRRKRSNMNIKLMRIKIMIRSDTTKKSSMKMIKASTNDIGKKSHF
jgi:hypothetical protein